MTTLLVYCDGDTRALASRLAAAGHGRVSWRAAYLWAGEVESCARVYAARADIRAAYAAAGVPILSDLPEVPTLPLPAPGGVVVIAAPGPSLDASCDALPADAHIIAINTAVGWVRAGWWLALDGYGSIPTVLRGLGRSVLGDPLRLITPRTLGELGQGRGLVVDTVWPDRQQSEYSLLVAVEIALALRPARLVLRGVDLIPGDGCDGPGGNRGAGRFARERELLDQLLASARAQGVAVDWPQAQTTAPALAPVAPTGDELLTTITPYRGRPAELARLCAHLAALRHPQVWHLVVAPGGLPPDEAALLARHGIELACPPDLPHGRMTIGHWHTWAIAEAVRTPYAMKLDVDCIPVPGCWDAVLARSPELAAGQWFNCGVVMASERATALLDHHIPLQAGDAQAIVTEAGGQRAVVNGAWVCACDAYLASGADPDGFVGYGWEDYRQHLALALHATGRLPIPAGLSEDDLLPACRDHAWAQARAVYALDPRLLLIHGQHPPSNDPAYKDQIAANRRRLHEWYLAHQDGAAC